MVAIQPLISEFTIVGKLKDFIIKSNGRVQYLQLSSDTGEYWLKVAKERQNILGQHLKVGCWLKVTGMRKNKLHQGEVEYKAYRIELLNQPISENSIHSNSDATTITKPKAKVLFCQKSNCWQQGGKAACESLKAELQNRGMSDRVEIKTTGCLKQCKQAPNIVILPDKVRYCRVQPRQISTFIDKHLVKSDRC